jgi:hypothetical protein
MHRWCTTKDEKGFGLRDAEEPQQEKECILQAERVSSQVEYRNSAVSLNTTLTGIPSGTTKCCAL